MSQLQKKESSKEMRRRMIIDTAFRIFVEQKIEPVSMGEIASAAGIGRATLFRYYANKLELVIAVCAAKWKEYLDELDAKRPLSSIGDIPAIDRFTFTLDSYIDMYRHHKDLLQYNDNFNHYVTHEGVREEQLREFHASLYSVDTRLEWMYEKAREDHTFRTDIPREEFMRVTVHTMMTACAYYAGGFIWGAEDNKDYTPELLRIKEMILNYAKISV
ncbi:TetR/AcrR family transcriptional regulator [Jutongia sp.]